MTYHLSPDCISYLFVVIIESLQLLVIDVCKEKQQLVVIDVCKLFFKGCCFRIHGLINNQV